MRRMNSKAGRPSIGHNVSNAITSLLLLSLMGLVLRAIAGTPPPGAKPRPQSAEAFKPHFQKFNPELSGNRLWFGVTFYDGEGITGVGGIGTFDLSTGQYSR